MTQAAARINHDTAEALAVDALTYLASDPERLERFLALSGLSPENLRATAASPGFLASVLAHFTQDEALLLDFAAAKGCDPKLILTARDCLDPPQDAGP